MTVETAATETTAATDTTEAAVTTPIQLEAETTTAATAEQTASTTADDGAITYEPTGDPGLDVALGFVGKLGIGAEHPAMVAAASGDFGLLKAHLATMGDKATGWPQMLALAEHSFANGTKAAEANNAAVTTAVHAVAGSAEAWAPVQAWASANADPAEKVAINAMFNAGPVQARAAAMMLMDAYAQANGTVVKPASATSNTTAATTAAPSHGPLSNAQFAAESNLLRARLGGNFEASPEYKALAVRALANRG